MTTVYCSLGVVASINKWSWLAFDRGKVIPTQQDMTTVYCSLGVLASINTWSWLAFDPGRAIYGVVWNHVFFTLALALRDALKKKMDKTKHFLDASIHLCFRFFFLISMVIFFTVGLTFVWTNTACHCRIGVVFVTEMSMTMMMVTPIIIIILLLLLLL